MHIMKGFDMRAARNHSDVKSVLTASASNDGLQAVRALERNPAVRATFAAIQKSDRFSAQSVREAFSNAKCNPKK